MILNLKLHYILREKCSLKIKTKKNYILWKEFYSISLKTKFNDSHYVTIILIFFSAFWANYKKRKINVCTLIYILKWIHSIWVKYFFFASIILNFLIFFLNALIQSIDNFLNSHIFKIQLKTKKKRNSSIINKEKIKKMKKKVFFL